MKKGIIIGIIVLVILIIILGGFFLFKSYNTNKENCVKEGERGNAQTDSIKKCCLGLTEIRLDFPMYGECEKVTDGFGCTLCGDGVCGKGENQCNCPVDCKMSEINESFKNCPNNEIFKCMMEITGPKIPDNEIHIVCGCIQNCTDGLSLIPHRTNKYWPDGTEKGDFRCDKYLPA